MSKVRVLFLCSGNSARSQMAEAFLRKYGEGQFEVYSAGLHPKPIHPFTIQVMNEAGCDLKNHSSKPLLFFIGKVDFNYLITVCSDADAECPIFPGMGVRLHWPFEDPTAFEGTYDEKLEKFRSVRDQIKSKVISWLSEPGISK